jgi:hypothetical protein
MKTLPVLTAVCMLRAFTLFGGGTNEMADGQFPYVIPVEFGAKRFHPGDQITITSVRGDRKHIEVGGSYLVEGTYTLTSVDHAQLALFCTSRGPSGPTPIQDGQTAEITEGTGKFRLHETKPFDGWLHVSIYSKGSHSHDAVYFGEKGKENTIMRMGEWFYDAVGNPTADRADDKRNRALMDYLGNPVPAPPGMDPRYNRENLLKAFTALCNKADLVITKLSVDDSEFPFLLYGTLDGRHKLPESPVFEEQKGYTYGGSVRGSTGEGATYFAVNMVPHDQYPADQEKACNRRLMLRLQMLADKASQTLQE